MNLLDLVRPDLRDFAGYSSARRGSATGSVWLNANENPWRNLVDDARAGAGLNRYPDPQPPALRAALAQLYGVRAEQVLIGRGSDEAIDLLVRALCRPQLDAVVIAPPVFGMYAVSARLQGAPLVEVPLCDGTGGFECDLDRIGDVAIARRARLVFLCTPANPTGQALSPDAIVALAQRLSGQAMVVVDEAYVEYSDQPSVADRVDAQPNLAVLRTLSKAHALAAARIGTLIAAPELITVLRNCQAPYPLPAPCVRLALDALSTGALERTRARVQQTRTERARVQAALSRIGGVRRVHPSQGNFLLVRFLDADAASRALVAAGIVVRDQRQSPLLHDALRISIGSPAENDSMLEALVRADIPNPTPPETTGAPLRGSALRQDSGRA